MNNKILFRILSGKIIVDIGKIYIIKPNSYEHRYWAEVIYEETLSECLMDECISKSDEKFKLMLYRAKLPYNYEEQLKDLRKQTEDKKVEIYELVREKKDSEQAKKEYKKLDDKVLDILGKLHCMDSITAEGVAEITKNKYLLKKAIGKRITDSTLDSVMLWLSKNYINESTFREIARSNYLFNITGISKEIFSNYPLTDEQISLMYWHRFYKNVYEHQERPFEWIISDDLALDGWHIYQSRKTGKSESIDYVESKIQSDAVRNSKEIYVVGGSKMSDVVYNANDESGKAYIKAKQNLINKGKLNESVEQKLGQGFGLTG